MSGDSHSGRPTRQGKVRDLYDWGDRLLLVATDRISAFDWVLPTLIPDKGRVLTQLSAFWFARLGQAHHLLATDLDDPLLDDPRLDEVAVPPGAGRDWLAGRVMLCRKCQPAPVECVVRGYLAGSGWKEYQQHGAVCGVALPAGLKLASRLPEPIFTPATKAESGHDENITFERMEQAVGPAAAAELRQRSLAAYLRGAELAAARGLLIADTKFEWGRDGDSWLLIDEALTPDSSRFWPAAGYQAGASPPSFDKQFVRQWLEETDWEKNSPPPPLPAEIVERTREKYIEAYERLTEQPFPWR